MFLEAWIGLSVHVQVRRRRKGTLVGIQVDDDTALDQEVYTDRSTAPVTSRVSFEANLIHSESGHSLPHMRVAFAMSRLRTIILIHAAVTLLAD